MSCLVVENFLWLLLWVGLGQTVISYRPPLWALASCQHEQTWPCCYAICVEGLGPGSWGGARAAWAHANCNPQPKRFHHVCDLTLGEDLADHFTCPTFRCHHTRCDQWLELRETQFSQTPLGGLPAVQPFFCPTRIETVCIGPGRSIDMASAIDTLPKRSRICAFLFNRLFAPFEFGCSRVQSQCDRTHVRAARIRHDSPGVQCQVSKHGRGASRGCTWWRILDQIAARNSQNLVKTRMLPVAKNDWWMACVAGLRSVPQLILANRCFLQVLAAHPTPWLSRRWQIQ